MCCPYSLGVATSPLGTNAQVTALRDLWNAPKTPGRATDIIWVGFTDARVGAALVQSGYDTSAKAAVTALWRTTDGGATWSNVRVG